MLIRNKKRCKNSSIHRSLREDKAVSSLKEFMASCKDRLGDCVPAVARYHYGCIFYLTTREYQGVWAGQVPSLNRASERKERRTLFGTDRPEEGQEALVLLLTEKGKHTLVSTIGLEKSECESGFLKQLWRDSGTVKTSAVGWAVRYRDLFDRKAHEADFEGGSAAMAAGKAASDVVSCAEPVKPRPRHYIGLWDDDAGSAVRKEGAAHGASAESVTPKVRRVNEADFNEKWLALIEGTVMDEDGCDEGTAEEREFEALVREVEPYGYTDAAQIGDYIEDHCLFDKYRRIAGMVRFRKYGKEGVFPGIKPEWYGKLCRRLGLGNRHSGAYATGFTSYADLNR